MLCRTNFYDLKYTQLHLKSISIFNIKRDFIKLKTLFSYNIKEIIFIALHQCITQISIPSIYALLKINIAFFQLKMGI